MPAQVTDIDADDARRTFVVATADREIAIDRVGSLQKWKARELVVRGQCGDEHSFQLSPSVGISSDGGDAYFLATDGSKRPPYRTLSAACLIDAETGQVSSLKEALANPEWLTDQAIGEQITPAIALGPRSGLALLRRRSEFEVVDRTHQQAARFSATGDAGECSLVAHERDAVAACIDRSKQNCVVQRCQVCVNAIHTKVSAMS